MARIVTLRHLRELCVSAVVNVHCVFVVARENNISETEVATVSGISVRRSRARELGRTAR